MDVLAGATFTATVVSGSGGGPFSCTTDATGTCKISVPKGFAWNISQTGASPNYYLSPNIDVGGTPNPTPYVFKTGTVNSNIDVAGANPNDGYTDQNNNTFSGLLASSFKNPVAPQKCGIKIAMVLDQSGSMKDNGKQASLKTAAKDVITALTGTPSTIAMYTFAGTADTAGQIAATSTATAASAAPLTTFVTNLPTPTGGTNWDRGLSQVPSGFDLVLFVTDGAPTYYGNASGAGNSTAIQYVEQGMFSANAIKSAGASLLGIGVGLTNGNGNAVDNLRAVSGPTSGTDYFNASDTTFGPILKDLATGACKNSLTIQKQIQNPDGTLISPAPADANGWVFTNGISHGSTIDPSTTTAVNNGLNGFGSAAVSIPSGAAPTVTVTEALKGGYTFVSAKCTVDGAAVNTTVTGTTTASFTGASNVAMACTFTNKMPQPPHTLTINKQWVNSIKDDSAGISLTPGGHSGTATSTGGNNTNTGVTSGTYYNGNKVTLAETPGGGNKGAYTTTLSCDGGTLAGSVLTMPNKDVTCTYKNTNTSATVTLQKTWVNGIKNDKANLSINGGTAVTSTSNGDTGSWTDSTHQASASVLVGSTVSLSEAFGSNAGTYGSTFACVGAAVIAGTNTIIMPNGPVTCTFTNTSQVSQLKVVKNWVDSHTGDTTTIALNSLTSFLSATAPISSSGSSYVNVGGSVTLAETMGSNNKASYNQVLTCVGVSPDANGHFTMPVGNVTCTFTNSAKAATVTLQKNWQSSVSGDSVALKINGTTGATSTSTGADGIDTGHVATAATTSGAAVTVAEAFGTKKGTYTSSTSCTNGVTPASDGSFTMPKTGDVTCTLMNTGATATVTLQKTWVDGIKNDTTQLWINSGSKVTSASGGQSGSWTDSGHQATATVPRGSTVDLNELMGTVKGDYTPTLSCTGVDGVTVGSPTFTMPTTGNVLCTYVNTNALQTVTLQKQWAKSLASDSADLNINGTHGTSTTTGGDVPAATVVTVSVPVGSTVAVHEELDVNNAATYGQTLKCTGVVPDLTAQTFTMPGNAVNCVFINSAATGTVTLQKAWVDSIAKDTADLSVNGTHGTSTTTGGTVAAANVVVTSVVSGSTVNLKETLGAGNAGTYKPTLKCTGVDGVSIDDQSFTMPLANVTCTYTNTNATATLTLHKSWINGVDGDAVSLDASGPSGTANGSSTVGGTSDTVTLVTPVGGQVNVAEAFAGTPKGVYTSTLKCTGWQTPVTELSASFTMPATAVDCEFVNTATQSNVILQKTWFNGLKGDATDLSLANGDATIKSTSTSNGDAGSWTDPHNINAPVALGSPVTVGEQLASGNGGAYDQALKCTQAGTSWTTTDASFTMPTTAGAVTCTYTNTLKTATLTLVKVVDTANGGSAVPSDFTLTATGAHKTVSGAGSDDPAHPNAAITNILVPIGAYSLSESTLAGYALTGLTCDTDAKTSPTNKTVTLTKGQDATCTYTNTAQQASLTLVKTVDNENGIGSATPSDWALSAAGPTPIDGVSTGTKTSVLPGNYNVSEALSSTTVGNYSTTSLVCKTAGGTVIDGVDKANPTVPVALGDSITCTYTNTAVQPTLTLIKNVDNGSTGGTKTSADWTLSAEGSTGTGITNSVSGVIHNVNAGIYTMTESAQLDGYTTDGVWTCTGVAGTVGPNSVSVQSGQNVTCTITNTAKQASLTLNKVVDNGETGATHTASEWKLTADGPTAITDVTTGTKTNVKTGTYQLSENGPAGYSASAWNCGSYDVNGGAVTVPLGASVDCTITNTAIAPELTLNKTVINKNGGTAKATDWTLNAGDALSGTSGVTGTVTVGTYNLTETDGPSGYTQTSLTCDNAQGPVQSVTLTVGDDVTCTFVNTDQPAALTLHKIVDANGSGTTSAPKDWTLTADPNSISGQDPVSGNGADGVVSIPVKAGAYALSESTIAGFTASAWTCTTASGVSLDGSTLTLANGAAADCSITNTAKTPKLTLEKTVVNSHGGSEKAGAWALTATGPSTITGATGSDPVTNAGVQIGTYTLTEQGPAGYQQTSLQCKDAAGAVIPLAGDSHNQLVMALADNVTCVFTNTDLPAHLTLAKIVDDNGTNAGKVPADWTLTATPQNITGQDAVSGNGTGITADGGVQNETVFSGTYKLSEDGPAGFTAGSWECAGGVVAGDLVTVPNGGIVDCHITNTATFPHLTLVKVVDNGNTGGTATDQDWTLTADGSASSGSTISGKTGSDTVTHAAVKVGTYDLSEFGTPVGYTASDWVCDGGSQDGAAVALTAGQNATCTITNTAIPASWTISKSSDPASGSTVQPGDLITYTVTATHTGGVIPAHKVFTDDISGWAGQALMQGDPVVTSGTWRIDYGPNVLTWTTDAFSDTATLTYTIKVNPGLWGATLENVVTPPEGTTCDEAIGCTTDNYTPHWVLTKSSDPISGSVVPVGSTVTYTLHAFNDSNATVAGVVATDDISDVIDNATLNALPAGLVLAPDGTHLIWSVPTMAAGSPGETISYSITVNNDAFGEHLKNVVTPDDSGICPAAPGFVQSDEEPPSCTTDNRVQKVDLAIVKTDNLDGAPVDSGKGDVIGYKLNVANSGLDPATNVTVSDPLPDGLTIQPGSIVAPAGWDTSTSTATKLIATFAGPFAAGDAVDITFNAVVGNRDRTGPTVPYPSIDNQACVSGADHDSDPTNNCSTDTTKVKSIAVTAQAQCKANAPLMSYSVTPYNVSGTPKIALIWWTTGAYAQRDPSINASDKAALLANGASQVDYIAMPAGWTSGDPITGSQLWPGAAVDGAGNAIAWPGWSKNASGTWVVDPSAPGYDLRSSAVVEIRINPSTAATEVYPPATPNCNPYPPKTVPSGLAKTGFDLLGPIGFGGLLLLLGAALFFWMRRRRADGSIE